MTTRRALRCILLSLSSLAFALGGFAGCGGGDDSTPGIDSGVDAAKDATTVSDSGSCSAPLLTCGGACVDEQTDPRNCGGCGAACGDGTDCEDGACVAPCLSGQTRCSGRCVALETDNVNCGACGTACATGQVCNGGTCDVTCGPPLTTCVSAVPGGDAGSVSDAGNDAAAAGARYCARLGSDESNCGGCGVTCAAGEQCDLGVCSATCAIGQSLCSGVCRDLSTDLANCGGCGTTCAAGQVCSGGVCQASCGLPFTLCGSACANTASDPLHCGGCATSCAPQNVKAAACSAGACSFVGCQGGFADCDGSSVNGCELAVSSDVANCGGCGHMCEGVHVAAEQCTGGSCGYTACQAGFGDCDGNLANGCETDLSSPRTCGTCLHACGAGGTCSSGVCGAAPGYFLPDFGKDVTFPEQLPWTISTGYANTTIYYTLDGTTPTLASPHGPSPLQLNTVAPSSISTTTVGWFAYDGTTASAVQYRTITNDSRAQNSFTGVIPKNLALSAGGQPGSTSSPVVVAAPGQMVNGVVDITTVDNTCSTCGLYVVFGTTSFAGCLPGEYGGDWPGLGATGLTFSIAAPSTPGVYPILFAFDAMGSNSCMQAEEQEIPSFREGLPPPVGIIIVP